MVLPFLVLLGWHIVDIPIAWPMRCVVVKPLMHEGCVVERLESNVQDSRVLGARLDEHVWVEVVADPLLREHRRGRHRVTRCRLPPRRPAFVVPRVLGEVRRAPVVEHLL